MAHDSQPHEWSLSQATKALDDKQISSRELTEASLKRIRASSLNTFLHLDEEGAKAAALASDTRRASGPRSPLDGIPIALKDLLITESMPTTAASKILKGYQPPYEGAMASRLHKAGAIIVGKTNMDEFAMGSSNEHSIAGPVKNPWDESRVAGGSSGGSAASVAAGQVFGALGTDTGGSIRQPASLCGVYGLKPTYSRVSRYGVIAFASSLDQVGPFGRTAEDIAHQLQVIAGFDERDSTSAKEPVPNYSEALSAGVEGMKIGVPKEYFGEGLDPEIETALQDALRFYESKGAKIEQVSLPHTEYAVAAYYIICTAEASSNLARYDGVRYGLRADEKELRRMYASSRFSGFGEEVRRRIMLGTYVLSAGYYEAYYGRAQKVRTLIRRDFERAFEQVDLLITPTSPVTAFGLSERLDDPLSMYLADIYTVSANLAGIPGLSMPAGLSKASLPIGLQLLGPWFGEPRLLSAAAAFETLGHAALRP